MRIEPAATLRDAEESLLRRIVDSAERHGYGRETSGCMADWQDSVRGLTGALEQTLDRDGVRPLAAGEDYLDDPGVVFGLEASRRHRERGVSLALFQGLFKYYRRAYLEELAERAPERADWLRTLETFFDRVELAFCLAWAGCGEESRLRELQESNRRLASSRSLFRSLVGSLAQPVAVLDAAGEARYANPAFQELRRRVTGSEESGLQERADWLAEALAEQRERGGAIRLRERPLTDGAETRYFDASLAAMTNAAGAFSGSVVLLDEVTEELRTRRAVERGRQERAGILEAMPIAVIITRVRDGIIRYANGAACDLLGAARNALEGGFAPDFYVDPADRERMVRQLLRQGSVRAYEIRLKREDNPLPCLVSAVAVQHFEEPCYLFTLLDISARKRIEEEIAKLSQALQQSPIAVFIFRRDGNVQYVNSAFTTLTGYSLLDVKDDHAREILVDSGDDGLVERIRKSLRAGRSWRGEINNRRKNGGEYWVMVHMAPLLDSEGRAGHFVAFMEDITKRKLAEAVLQERLQFIQTLMDAVPTPIFYKNVRGVYQGCNRAFEDYFGVSRPTLIGKTVLNLATDSEATLSHKQDVELAARGGVHIYEGSARRKDGALRDAIFHKAAFLDARGRPAGIVGSVTDITERKRAEREARENESTLRQAMTGIRAGILVIDPQTGIIEDVNDRVLELLDGVREAYVGRLASEVLSWRDARGHPVQAGDMLRPQSDREYRLERPGRGVLPVVVTVLPSQVRGMQRILQIFFDLSERKALERQLNLAQKLESVGQLAAGIAHEINTPIQYVSSNLSYLTEAFERLMAELGPCGARLATALRSDMEEIPGAIQDAREGVDRVSAIVQAMRKFSHPGEEEQVSVDVNEAIRNTVTIARNEWKYYSDVELELDENLPSVVCVPGDFNQVVLNVLVNAAHAVAEKVGDSGGKGQIRIRTARDGDFARIEIADTGGGISEANRDKIYDPFFTTKVVGKGTGQGLAITHAIVERHHGSIDFQTEPGVGTTFVIRFPLEGLQGEGRA